MRERELAKKRKEDAFVIRTVLYSFQGIFSFLRIFYFFHVIWRFDINQLCSFGLFHLLNMGFSFLICTLKLASSVTSKSFWGGRDGVYTYSNKTVHGILLHNTGNIKNNLAKVELGVWDCFGPCHLTSPLV